MSSVVVPAEVESPYLIEEEAAKYLRMGMSTLSMLRCRGGGPPYRKHGRPVLYTVRDLDEWSEARLRASVEDERARPLDGPTE